MRRAIPAAVLLTIGLALPSAAGASVTLGQTFAPPSNNSCLGGPDWEVLQTGNASGPSYKAPSSGVLTSWSFQAGSQETVLTLRVFRPTGTANQYRPIADASELKTIPMASGLHTFPAQVPVQAGDFIGIRSTIGACASLSNNPADTYAYESGTVTPIGAPEDFTELDGYIWDISAVLEPTNSFTIGAVQRNKTKGTATLTVDVPNQGELTASGNGVKVASTRARSSKAVTPGAARLAIKAKGKKKRKLNETGKVKLSITISYTPTGGSPSTQSAKVKLKKL